MSKLDTELLIEVICAVLLYLGWIGYRITKSIEEANEICKRIANKEQNNECISQTQREELYLHR